MGRLTRWRPTRPTGTVASAASWLRSLLAIGLGIAATAWLHRHTVDPAQATIVRLLQDTTGERMALADWVYLVAMTLARYGPFGLGALLAGALAPPDRVVHALLALDLAIVLWLLGAL